MITEKINYLIKLYSQGKYQKALNSLKRLCKDNPSIMSLHNLQGACYLALSQLEKAVVSFQYVLKVSPQNINARYNLAMAYGDLGYLNKSVACYRRVLVNDPNHIGANNNLGNVLRQLDQNVEAIECFNKAIELNPNFAMAYNNLGSTYLSLFRIDDALESYKRAIKISPDFAEAYNNLGNAYSDLGNLKLAKSYFEKALEINPCYFRAHRNLSVIKTFSSEEPQIKMLNELYSSKDLNDSQRMELSFTLAKVYDDLIEPEKSFSFLEQGNKLYKKNSNYHINTDRQLFKKIRIAFEQLEMKGVSSNEKNDSFQRPIFIVGMPRSGTSLVEQILSSHSQVYGAGELNIIEKYMMKNLSIRAGSQEKQSVESNIELKKLRAVYFNDIKKMNIQTDILTDKMPMNFRWVGFILKAFPEAKIIHLKRDPIATCWSIYKHFFPSGGIGYAYDFGDLSELYKLYSGMMSYWNEKFPNSIYNLSYEKLTENQREETQKLLKFCSLDLEERCISFHENKRMVKTASSAQVREKMYTGSSERWKKYETQLQPLIEALK